MTHLSFSQTIYPQSYQVGKDTLVVITFHQLSLTNSFLQQRKELQKQVFLLNDLNSTKDSLISALSIKTELLSSSYQSLSKDYAYQLQQNAVLKNSIEESKKSQLKTSFIVGGVSITLGITVGILIMALR